MKVLRDVSKPKPKELLPMDLEAERLLLGSILVNNQNLFAVQAALTGDDFYAEPHRLIFQAMVCATPGETP